MGVDELSLLGGGPVIRYAFYGTLMEGESRAPALEGLGEYGGPCVIPGELYDLRKFPALLPSPSGRVKGQLWYAAPGLMEEARRTLDTIEAVPVFWAVSLELIEPGGTALVYVWNSFPLSPFAHIWSGDWRRRAVAG